MPTNEIGKSSEDLEVGRYRDGPPNQEADEGAEPENPRGLHMSTLVMIVVGLAILFSVVGYFLLWSETESSGQEPSQPSSIQAPR